MLKEHLVELYHLVESLDILAILILLTWIIHPSWGFLVTSDKIWQYWIMVRHLVHIVE